jgi:hypothetical protein
MRTIVIAWVAAAGIICVGIYRWCEADWAASAAASIAEERRRDLADATAEAAKWPPGLATVVGGKVVTIRESPPQQKAARDASRAAEQADAESREKQSTLHRTRRNWMIASVIAFCLAVAVTAVSVLRQQKRRPNESTLPAPLDAPSLHNAPRRPNTAPGATPPDDNFDDLISDELKTKPPLR